MLLLFFLFFCDVVHLHIGEVVGGGGGATRAPSLFLGQTLKPVGLSKIIFSTGPSTYLLIWIRHCATYSHRIKKPSPLSGLPQYCSFLGLGKFTPMTMTFVYKKGRSSLKQAKTNKSFIIFQMLMNARSTPMTATPMQSALTQKGHLLANATWMRIPLVTGKHALLIVSRAICSTSVCSIRFSFLYRVWPLWQLLISSLWKKLYPPIIMSPNNNSRLFFCRRIYYNTEISNALKARFVCLFCWLLLTFLGSLILSVFQADFFTDFSLSTYSQTGVVASIWK